MGIWSGIYKGLMAAEEAKRSDADAELEKKRFDLLERQFEENKYASRQELAIKLRAEARARQDKIANFNRQMTYLGQRGLTAETLERLAGDPNSLESVYKKVSTAYVDLTPEELNTKISVVGGMTSANIGIDEAFEISDNTDAAVSEASTPGTGMDSQVASSMGLVTVEFRDGTQETFTSDDYRNFDAQLKVFEDNLAVEVNARINALEAEGKKAEASALANDFKNYDPKVANDAFTRIRVEFGPRVKQKLLKDINDGLYDPKFAVGFNENPYLATVPVVEESVQDSGNVTTPPVDNLVDIMESGGDERTKAIVTQFMRLTEEQKAELREKYDEGAYRALEALAARYLSQQSLDSMTPPPY